jgi:hypothetical protein
MTNRRQFLQLCAATTISTAYAPVQALDASYQSAVNKIWRPKSSSFANAASRNKEWVRMATLAASSHNTQPWKFLISEQSISIFPDFKRRCPAVDPDDSHLYKSLGCAAENIVHSAAADGFHADVQFDPTQDAVVVNFDSAASKQENLADSIVKRSCSRTPYDGKPITAPAQEALTAAATTNGISPLILQSPKQMESMLEYVRQGNLAQFDDPAFVKELRDWVRFNPSDAIATGDGLAGEVSGQASLPRWIGRAGFSLFLTGNTQADIDAKAIRSSAGIIAFVGERDDKASWVAAGRAYQRFALQATALNIRNAFINQPIEVRQLRPQLHAWLGVPQQHVHLIARYGNGKPTPHSLRRPIEDVIIS